MDKVKVGIIGCGGIANAKHMPALIALGDVEMTAFCDIVADRAEKAAKDFGVPGAKVFADYKELVKEDLDVIHVLTPNRSHGEITVAALEAGKHVMCEKPMAKTPEDAKLMLEAAKRTGKKLSVAYQNRYRKDSLTLKEACKRGDLGEIYFAKAHAVRRRGVPTWGVFLNEYEQGGGPLIDIGTHALDLTLWLMDNYEPESVMGSTFKKLGDQTNTGNTFGDWKPEEFTVEDSAFGFIKMKNGATIYLEASWALNTLDEGSEKTTLCGTKGGADMRDGLTFNKADLGLLTVSKPELKSGGVAFFHGKKPENAKDVEARMWIDCIKNDTDVFVKPEEALVVTQILDAIYESARTGKAVYF